MKLLFDENLSPRLVGHVGAAWPESAHVSDVAMHASNDEAIWAFARDNGFCLVSKDDDFRSLALLRGAPPKVIWLQTGNASTIRIRDFLLSRVLDITHFENRTGEALLVLRE